MNKQEQYFYESVVHGLRSRGWSRACAEEEAADRVYAARLKLQKKESQEKQNKS